MTTTLQYLQLTDTFKVWKEKINSLIDKNNDIIVGTEDNNIPTNDIVDSKIESAIDVITQDNIALILTLS